MKCTKNSLQIPWIFRAVSAFGSELWLSVRSERDRSGDRVFSSMTWWTRVCLRVWTHASDTDLIWQRFNIESHDHVVAGSVIWDSAPSAHIKNTGAGFLPAVLPPISSAQEGSREIHSKLCFFLGEYVKPDDLDFVDCCMSSYYQSVSSLLESSGRFEAWSHGPGTSSLANSVSCNHDVCNVLVTSLVRGGVSEHAGKDQLC